MVNSAYAIAEFLAQLPEDVRPEAMAGRDGFIHPNSGVFGVETSQVRLLLRDFDAGWAARKEQLVRELAAATAARLAA